MADMKENIVPQQHEGVKKDIEEKVVAADEADARKLFFIARNRLLNINEWHDISGAASAEFSLTDEKGNALNRTAEKGDFFQIDIPGPGSNDGEGFDWVQIEAVEEAGSPESDYESIAMRVRPVKNPHSKSENTAHFLKNTATSTFAVVRKGREVTAAVYGRNEVPNTETTNLLDKIRNAVIGTTAIAGISNVQWNLLVKGLIATEE